MLYTRNNLLEEMLVQRYFELEPVEGIPYTSNLMDKSHWFTNLACASLDFLVIINMKN